jgi:hypothetical protein
LHCNQTFAFRQYVAASRATSDQCYFSNELLAACKSLKVKRLFLFLGSRYQYPWFEQLDRSAIDLGKGKRLIVRGGRYDREFRITVPERFGAER